MTGRAPTRKRTAVGRSRRFCRAAQAAALVLLVAACDRRSAVPADVAVTIDGERIVYAQFEAYLRELGVLELDDGEALELESDVQSRLFDQFLDELLLSRLAIERGLVLHEPAAAAGEGGRSSSDAGVERRRAIAFLLRDGFDQPVTDGDVEGYYHAHLAEYQRPEEVHLRQILTHEREGAEAALRALVAGEDFRQVAARFSQGPRAHLGGDQGRLAKDDLPSPFIDVVFALAPGEVSDVVTADYGFLIFQVVERFPAEAVPLAAVAEEIRQTLQRRRIDQLVEGFVAEARDRYNVKVFPTNLPFDYRGFYAE